MGFHVTLYNRTFYHITALKARGGIDLECAEGGPHGFAKLALVTSDLKEALQDAQMVMVVVPSSAHADVDKSAAPYLKDGQIVVLHPGRTCGALEFSKVLRDQVLQCDVGRGTFIYAYARWPASASSVSKRALAACRRSVPKPCSQPLAAYPQFIDGGNVLVSEDEQYGSHFPSRTDTAQCRLDRGHPW
jgi:opine dehydrogenase